MPFQEFKRDFPNNTQPHIFANTDEMQPIEVVEHFHNPSKC